MLVIGFRDIDNHSFSKELEVETTDDPKKVHDLLKKEANGLDFSSILLIENDEVIASYVDTEDYDLSDDDAEDDAISPDDELDFSDED